jgi:hypothetical protein
VLQGGPIRCVIGRPTTQGVTPFGKLLITRVLSAFMKNLAGIVFTTFKRREVDCIEPCDPTSDTMAFVLNSADIRVLNPGITVFERAFTVQHILTTDCAMTRWILLHN